MHYLNKKLEVGTAHITLKEARNTTQALQANAANQYGIDGRTLRRWENGEVKANLTDFVGLMNMYGYDVHLTKRET